MREAPAAVVILAETPYRVVPVSIAMLKAIAIVDGQMGSTDAFLLIREAMVRASADAIVPRNPSHEEIKTAIATILRLSGMKRKEEEAAEDLRRPTRSVFLIGGREFEVPALSDEQFWAIHDHAPREVMATMACNQALDLITWDVHAALSAVGEIIERGWIEENIDLPTAYEIIWNLRCQIDMRQGNAGHA